MYLPTALVVPVTPAHRDALARVLPWTQPMAAREGRATAYVCRDFACQTPAVRPDELEAQLEAMEPVGQAPQTDGDDGHLD